MTKKRFFALLMAFAMILSVSACGTPAATDEPTTDPGATSPAVTPTQDAGNPTEDAYVMDNHVLVIGQDAAFDEKWNPFLCETVYDHAPVDQVFAAVSYIDFNNELQPYAGDISYELTSDGGVLYTVTINKGMYFSDGVPVTIDDFIYGVYVRADASYTGRPGSLLSSTIEGIKEYYYDDPNYGVTLEGLEAEAEAKYSTENISWEDFLYYAEQTALDGWWDGDPEGDIGNGQTWGEYAVDEGYEDQLNGIDATSAQEMFELIALIEYENYAFAYDTYNWYLEPMQMALALEVVDSDVVRVPEISGVKKIDDYTCTIKDTKIDIYGDRLATKNGMGNLVPRHYYGEFKKGDVSKVLANMSPMGSGPYIWGGFDSNIVTCTANPNFFLGAPKTGTVRWQYIPREDTIPALQSGQIDICVPNANLDNVAILDADPSIRYDLIDNAGYGYMGMNTNRVPLLVRKGFWCLMNRQPAVEAWYGPLAKVIERPMTTTLAEYPQDAEPYYPVSRDQALEYFIEAGYTQQNGKLVDASGNQLVLNCYIGGSGKGDHPAYAMLVQAAEDMSALGGEIQIQDVDFPVLNAAMNDGSADAWIMAWGSVFDCDKSSQFKTGGGQNRYRFSDARMDELLELITETIDLDARRALIAEMLDLAMENCVEFPLYQRKNMIAYNTTNLNMDSIPTATTSCDYESFLYLVEMTN